MNPSYKYRTTERGFSYEKNTVILLSFLFLLIMAACGNTSSSENLPAVEPDGSQQTTTDESNQVTEQDKNVEPEIPEAEPLEMENVYQNILASVNAGDDLIMFRQSF